MEQKCKLQVGREHYEEHLCELILKFGTVVQEMSVKVFSFDSHFVCLQNHLRNFNRGLYGEHLLKIF